MNIKHNLTSAFGSIALIACFAGASPRANAQSYIVTDLGVLPEKKMSSPAAINNQAQVAGTSFADASNQSAFIYYNNKNQMEDVGKVAANSVSRAFGINDAGSTVGDSQFGGSAYGPSLYSSHATLFANGSAYDLGSLHVGEYSRANGINSGGVVVGFSGAKQDGNSSRAFLWSAASGMVDIGTLGGAYAQAFSINDAGFVTGNSERANGKVGSTHAFLYQSASMTNVKAMQDLGTLGGNSSYGTFINANNHVVGYSVNNGGRVHAFLHAGVKMEDLGSLGGKAPQSDQSFALGINAFDQVVGYTYLPINQAGALSQPQPVAFFYQNGVMRDLNNLIGTAAKNYRLSSATAINDKGQIIANALEYGSGTYHAVLLTPQLTYPPQRSSRAAAKK